MRYVTDSSPGVRRHRRGGGFVYLDAAGKPIADPRELARLKSLAIPPAYNNVWISSDPNGHLQATGRDARGRKQYRYHPRWRTTRDETKFERMLEFAGALPRIRRKVQADLRLDGLPREKVLAAVVRLLDATRLRVGNEEYARANKSYGLTTLRTSHVAIRKDSIRFRFRGKGGIFRTVDVTDARLAKLVRRCRDLPGQELFQYLDAEGNAQAIDSADVNEYLRAAAGGAFSAKDFRTWHASVEFVRAVWRLESREPVQPSIALANGLVAEVAQTLGNTPAICRKCYVHPGLFDQFVAGTLSATLANGKRNTLSQGERAIARWLRGTSPRRKTGRAA